MTTQKRLQLDVSVATGLMLVFIAGLAAIFAATPPDVPQPKVIFTQGTDTRWSFQIVGPRGELLASSPHENYEDQPEAFRTYHRLATVMRSDDLQTIINPLPPKP